MITFKTGETFVVDGDVEAIAIDETRAIVFKAGTSFLSAHTGIGALLELAVYKTGYPYPHTYTTFEGLSMYRVYRDATGDFCARFMPLGG